MISEHDDDVIRAMKSWLALDKEYVEKYVNTEPLTAQKNPVAPSGIAELTPKVIAAEQNYRKLRLQYWKF